MPHSDDPQAPAVHVVAGVIRDARGRILLARRTEGRDLAGLWEFPGGKVEPGETPQAALARELREELGIAASARAPLIRVPQQYPHKRLVLDVHDVAHTGTPRGLDGQALAWAFPHQLASYPMPPGDRPVVAALLQPDRYLVTPAPGADDGPWLAALEQALATGVRRVQLRAPAVAPARWARLAARAVALCRQAGAEVLLNGDPALAARLGAGLHLRAAQLHEAGARAATESPHTIGIRTGPGSDLRAAQSPDASADGAGRSAAAPDSRRAQRPALLAASCHDADDLQRAQALGCDFVVLGPVHPTASHPGAPGIGWDAFAALRETVSLPIYAIGGLEPAAIPDARRHGAQGIAAIRGLWPGS